MTARKLILTGSIVGALAVAFLSGKLGYQAAPMTSTAPVVGSAVSTSFIAPATSAEVHPSSTKQEPSSAIEAFAKPAVKPSGAFRIEQNMIVPPGQAWSKFSPQRIVVTNEPGLSVDFDLVSTRTENGRTINNYRNPVDGSFLVSAASDDRWVGIMAIPGADSYEITMTSAGMEKVIKNGENEICGDLPSAKEGESYSLLSPEAAAEIAADGALVVVDVGFFATAGTINAQGGQEAYMTKIMAMIEACNAVLANSEIAMTWRALHLTQVADYTRDGKLSTDLRAISSGELSSFAKNVQDEKGNDITVLLVSGDTDYAGLAWMPGNESVVMAGSGFQTLAHEIGHNFGCNHDRETVGESASQTSYNFGVRFKDEQNHNFDTGTVMSYAGVRVEYFSNPTKSYRGHALGVAEGGGNPADNSRVIRANMASKAANKAVPTAPVIITQPVSASISSGGNITLSVLASGGSLKFQWQKDGADIVGATTAYLTKYNITTADAGAYKVKVTNSLGEVASNDAMITVNPVVPPAAPPKTSGGGGGAVSPFALLAVGALAALRKIRRKN